MQSRITQLLERHAGGDPDAFDELMPLVYDELRRLARAQRRRSGGGAAGSGGSTLDTTALAHEAYLRLAGAEGGFEHRGHFFAVAAVAMRRLLVNEARRRRRLKRGGDARPVTLAAEHLVASEQYELVLAVDEALDRLERFAPRLRAVVELRFILGLSEVETSQALAVSDRTVRRDWIKARAWLEVELGEAALSRSA
ncbi:MAG: ECF-type sigma factor [Acidobacteriota bacterium]